MLTVTVLLSIAVLTLGALTLHQRTRLARLRDGMALPDAHADRSAGHDAIVVTIRNHDEVAASRNRLAPTLWMVSPGLVRTIVHRETASELRARLAAEGVDADVRVRRVVPRVQAD